MSAERLMVDLMRVHKHPFLSESSVQGHDLWGCWFVISVTFTEAAGIRWTEEKKLSVYQKSLLGAGYYGLYGGFFPKKLSDKERSETKRWNIKAQRGLNQLPRHGEVNLLGCKHDAAGFPEKPTILISDAAILFLFFPPKSAFIPSDPGLALFPLNDESGKNVSLWIIFLQHLKDLVMVVVTDTKLKMGTNV